MTKKAIIASLAAVLVVCAGGYTWVGMQPAVRAEEVAEAREELERYRQFLNDAACGRRPIFAGATSDAGTNAMSLEELLSHPGPFAECWNAAQGSGSLWLAVDGDARGVPPLSLVVDGRLAADVGDLDEVVEQCEALPAELARQGRATDQCAPKPDSDEWRRMIAGGRRPPTRLKFLAHAAIALAIYRAAEGDVGGALRLLVQCLAVLRDSMRGPATSTMVLFAYQAEGEVIQAFQWALMQGSPSEEDERLLDDALSVLASGPVDAQTMLAADAISNYDEVIPHLGGNTELEDIRDYMSGAQLMATMEKCPAGVTARACEAALVFPPPSGWEWYQVVHSEREELQQGIELLLEASSVTTRLRLSDVAEHEHNFETLRRLLHWAGERREGRCPAPGPDGNDAQVAADGTGNFLVSAGEEDRVAFRFMCPLDPSQADEPPGR